MNKKQTQIATDSQHRKCQLLPKDRLTKEQRQFAKILGRELAELHRRQQQANSNPKA